MTKNGKVMANKFFSEYDGEKLANEMSDFVNSFSFDLDGFLEGVNEQEKKQKILDVFFLWIKHQPPVERKGFYDARNEYSVQTANKLQEVFRKEIEEVSERLGYNTEWEITSEDTKEVAFVKKMGREHRTLQQSFSKIVFRSLLLFPELEGGLQNLEEGFWKMPMI